MPYMNHCRRPRALLFIVICVLALVGPARAGSIFDDDWVPPPPRKPIIPPQDALPTKPTDTAPSARKTENPPPPAASTDTPATTPSAARRPIPDKAAQAKSRKLFKEVFAKELADRSATARRALANRLIDEAKQNANAPSDQFVLLTGATDAAREGSDLALCVRASNALAASYDVDALQMKSDVALRMTLRADDPTVSAENCRAGLRLVDQLVATDDYAAAARLLSALRAPASADPKLSALVQARWREVDATRAAFDRLPAHIAKLKASPDDAAANLAVGTWLCFMKGEWDRGMPLLGKGGDPAIKTAAALDLRNPTDGDKQIEVGDAWWTAADKDSSVTKGSMRERAVHWYGIALHGGGLSALARARLEQRLAAVQNSSAAARPTKQAVLFFSNRDAGGGNRPHFLENIAINKLTILSKADAAAALAQPGLSGATIIIFEANRWRFLNSDEINETARSNLQQFVRGGGDLILFEQYGQEHMSIIDSLFGLTTRGGGSGATFVHPDLLPKLKDAGYDDVTLKALHFWNGYDKLPDKSIVLLKSGARNTAVIVPFGSGRVVLIGLANDTKEEKAEQAILEMLYPDAADE